LDEALERLTEAEDVLRTLAAPPLYPAIVIENGESEEGPQVLVNSGGILSVVNVHPEVEANSLEMGDAVLLGPERNVILGVSQFTPFETGQLSTFVRSIDGNRAVVRFRGEEVVARLRGSLEADSLDTGDLLRWNEGLGMALERLDRLDEASHFIEETPEETLDDIGGLDDQIHQVMEEVGLLMRHGDLVKKYRLRPAKSITMVGPPGGGKTLLARGIANWLATVSASGRARFMNIKPGGFGSIWYSQTEANLRTTFEVARRVGDEEPEVPVVMFLDEVDSIASTRGHSVNRVDDRIMDAFLTELDGFESRGNVLVMAATNRQEVLDPAVVRPGRLGDLIVPIPRPNRDAARSILERHLPPDIPYADSETGSQGVDARNEILDTVVSWAYAPNGLGLLATLTFRDGTTQEVEARHLMSGALLANVARIASKTAGFREARTGEEGVRKSDVLEALEEILEGVVGNLTTRNCHRFLDDLPQDLDVVRIDLTQNRVRLETRYLTVA
jgi:proteasome-associated ATPase